MIRLLRLGVELYGYSEQDDRAWEAASDLYRRAPDDWQVVDLYLTEGRLVLGENELVSIIDHLIEIAPRECSSNYKYAVHFYFLWLRCKSDQYRQDSLRHYREALKLGLDQVDPYLALVTRRALVRLEDQNEEKGL
jgi:hypothetical protein